MASVDADRTGWGVRERSRGGKRDATRGYDSLHRSEVLYTSTVCMYVLYDIKFPDDAAFQAEITDYMY